MKKRNLKEGVTVKLADGTVYTVKNRNLVNCFSHYIPLEEYDDEGQNLRDSNLDVVKIVRH